MYSVFQRAIGGYRDRVCGQDLLPSRATQDTSPRTRPTIPVSACGVIKPTGCTPHSLGIVVMLMNLLISAHAQRTHTKEGKIFNGLCPYGNQQSVGKNFP